MQQLERIGERTAKYCAHVGLLLLVVAVHAGLGKLDVPVAEFRPYEIVYLLRRKVKVKAVHVGGYLADYGIEPVQQPLIGYVKLGYVYFANLCIAYVHKHEARCVIKLVAEVARGFNLLCAEAHISARSVAGNKAEAQAVRAVLLYYFQRIHAVAKGFGHFAAQFVPNKAVNVNIGERLLMHHFHAEHYHSGYPEEYYVVAGNKGACGIEVFKLLCMLGPPKR